MCMCVCLSVAQSTLLSERQTNKKENTQPKHSNKKGKKVVWVDYFPLS